MLSLREGNGRWQGRLLGTGGGAVQWCKRLLPLCNETACAWTHAELLKSCPHDLAPMSS